MDKIFPDGFSIKDEANAITAFCFRNGMLESIHEGEYSDLIYDESMSRISDDEIKALMIEASSKLCSLLELKETDPDKYKAMIEGYGLLYCASWER